MYIHIYLEREIFNSRCNKSLSVYSFYSGKFSIKFESFPDETFLKIRLVQWLSHVRLFVTPWIATRQASLSITNSQSSLKLVSIESVMPSNHLILCRPLLLLPPIPSSIRIFSNESTPCMRWPKYWSFSFSISPSNEHSGLISFRMDWLYLLAVQGTLKSLLQHICIKDISKGMLRQNYPWCKQGHNSRRKNEHQKK